MNILTDAQYFMRETRVSLNHLTVQRKYFVFVLKDNTTINYVKDHSKHFLLNVNLAFGCLRRFSLLSVVESS